MEDCTSDDIVVVVDSESEDEQEKRPLFMLIDGLVRKHQTIIPTDALIIEILEKEFYFNIETYKTYEKGIFMYLIKTYFRKWPKWTELQQLASKLCTNRNNGRPCSDDDVIKYLNNVYVALKKYLGRKINRIKLSFDQVLQKIAKAEEEDYAIPSTSSNDAVASTSGGQSKHARDVDIGVSGTKQQSGNLVHRKPTRIPLPSPGCVVFFKAVLNYWWTDISIELPNLVLHRELVYVHKYNLVNNNNEKTAVEAFDNQLYEKYKTNETGKGHSKSVLLKYFDSIIKRSRAQNNKYVIQLLTILFNILQKDLNEGPNVMKVPSNFKRNACKYPYRRYTPVDYEDNPTEQYRLEENMMPNIVYCIEKFGKPPLKLPPLSDWLSIECKWCNLKIPGSPDMMRVVQAHFKKMHSNEQAWECMHCNGLFSMEFLGENRWKHDC